MQISMKRLRPILAVVLAVLIGIASVAPAVLAEDTSQMVNTGVLTAITGAMPLTNYIFENGNTIYSLDGNGILQTNSSTASGANYPLTGSSTGLQLQDSSGNPFTFSSKDTTTSHYATTQLYASISSLSTQPILYVATYGKGSGTAFHYYIYSFNTSTGVETGGFDLSNYPYLLNAGYKPPSAMTATADGGFVLLMRAGTSGSLTYILAKFSSNGTLQCTQDITSQLTGTSSYSSSTSITSASVFGMQALGDGSFAVYNIKNGFTASTSGSVFTYSFNNSTQAFTSITSQTVNFSGISNGISYLYKNTTSGMDILSGNSFGAASYLYSIPYSSGNAVSTPTTIAETADYDSTYSGAGTADSPIIFGKSYSTSIWNVYSLTGTGAGTPAIPLPTNTTATNSTTAWKPAGKFANTGFAVNKVAHMSGTAPNDYYYLLQKDGDYAKVVRYQDAVDGNGNYIQDSAFTPYDLTDNNGAKLNVNPSDGGQHLDGFDVDNGGTVYAWTSTYTPAYILGQYGNVDMVYAYQKGAYAWSKSWTLDQGSTNGPLGDEVLGLHAWPTGGIAILTYTILAGNTNTPATVYRYDSSGNQTALGTPASYNGYQSNYNGVTGLQFHQTLSPNLFGMNSSGSVGIVAPANVNDTSSTHFSTAASIDSSFDASSEARANFPVLATGTSLFGVIPTSHGDIVATRTSSGTVDVDEYNNYTGTDVTNASGKFDVWPTSFTDNTASTGSSTLGGTETDPIVYSYGTDGQTIYVEGLQSSEIVENGTVVAPSAPQNVNAVPGDKQVSLTWNTMSNANSYTVHYGTDASSLNQTDTVTGNSATISDLTDGTTYYFAVSATNTVGEGSSSTPPVSAIPQVPAPTMPTGLATGASDGQVSLSWTGSTDATSYIVYYNTDKNNLTQTQIVTAGTSAIISGLTNGTTYYFAVSAKNAGGESDKTTVTSSEPVPPVPGVPTNLSVTPGDGQVNISWSAVDGSTSYTIYYGTAADALTSKWTVTNGTSAAISGLTNGRIYYFAVTTTNLGGESHQSAQATATPVPPAPSVPSGVTAVAGDKQISLSWNAVSGATGYTVYYGISANSMTNKEDITSGTSAAVKGLMEGVTYYFAVSAENLGGESSLSATANATPKPAVPTGLKAIVGDSQVALSWTAVAGASSYNIYDQSGRQYTTANNSTAITGLTNGTAYSFTLRTVEDGVESDGSESVTVTPQASSSGSSNSSSSSSSSSNSNSSSSSSSSSNSNSSSSSSSSAGSSSLVETLSASSMVSSSASFSTSDSTSSESQTASNPYTGAAMTPITIPSILVTVCAMIVMVFKKRSRR